MNGQTKRADTKPLTDPAKTINHQLGDPRGKHK